MDNRFEMTRKLVCGSFGKGVKEGGKELSYLMISFLIPESQGSCGPSLLSQPLVFT